jgi:hypothetical protein
VSTNPQTMKHIPFLALTVAALPLLVSRNENPMIAQLSSLIGVIGAAAIPALRVEFTMAVIISLFASVFIWRRRHKFFDSDPNVEDDMRVVRHNREVIVFVRAGQTLVLLFTPYQVWST